MKKIAALICAAFLAVSGVCAQSEITVKRAVSPINAGFREQIYIDGSLKLTLVNGMEGKIPVADGEHIIRAELSMLKTEARFSVRSGSITFVVTPQSAQQLIIEQGGGSPASSPSARSGVPFAGSALEGALSKAASELAAGIPNGETLAVLSISSTDSDLAEFVIEELAYFLVNTKKFKVVDRKSLDAIRVEQQFQYSGDVDDNSAVALGKMLGATTVITGSISGSDSTRRLRAKALNVKTAQILVMASERF